VAHGGEELGLGPAGEIGAQIGRAQLCFPLFLLRDVLRGAERKNVLAGGVVLVLDKLEHPADRAIRPDDAIGDRNIFLAVQPPLDQGIAQQVPVVGMDELLQVTPVRLAHVLVGDAENLQRCIRIGDDVAFPVPIRADGSAPVDQLGDAFGLPVARFAFAQRALEGLFLIDHDHQAAGDLPAVDVLNEGDDVAEPDLSAGSGDEPVFEIVVETLRKVLLVLLHHRVPIVGVNRQPPALSCPLLHAITSQRLDLRADIGNAIAGRIGLPGDCAQGFRDRPVMFVWDRRIIQT
jgi:hypothetical protein